MEVTEGASAPVGESTNALVAERKAKREALRSLGIDPYPIRFDPTASVSELRQAYTELPADSHTGVRARVAGRVTSMRGHGRLSFIGLTEGGESIQLLVQVPALAASAAAVLENCDLGDWIGAGGEIISSRRGELSVDVDDLQMLSKSLRPLPDKWHGLAEAETRYRQRELDLIANEETRRIFDVRFRTVASLRQNLVAEGFVEVDTPILQPQAGGAIARPFTTHANALDIDLTLRIAPELYLKRLVIGGYERVFEIARNFRNEGIDTRHSPEFTLLEAYRAFGDVNDGMALTERLIVSAARDAAGRLEVTAGEQRIDLTPPWPQHQLLDLVEEKVGTRLHPSMDVVAVQAVCETHGVAFKPEWGSGKLIFEIYDVLLMPSTTGPVFIRGFPIEVSPLARRQPDDDTLADRFELVMDGREFANGYSELNIPEEQEDRFRAAVEAAAHGDLEAHPADLAYVRSLEFGLPPTSGIGIGVDRLVMLLSGARAIRDVILFPMLRPEAPT